jgi:hypothetical protein
MSSAVVDLELRRAFHEINSAYGRNTALDQESRPSDGNAALASAFSASAPQGILCLGLLVFP